MATREEVYGSAGASLRSRNSSLGRLGNDANDSLLMDEDELMMRDLHDAGIIDDDEMALMQGPTTGAEEDIEELMRNMSFKAEEVEELDEPPRPSSRKNRRTEESLVNQEHYRGGAGMAGEADEEELHVIPDGAEEEEDYEEMPYEEDENLDNNDAEESPTGNIYQHEVSKPRYKVGRKQISIAEAQLYGLMDKDGNISLKDSSKPPPKSHAEKMATVANLTRKGRPFVEKDEEELANCTFQPKRSVEALKAMKNKRCGYDFMDRLGSGGDFLDRLAPNAGKKKKIPQSQYDALKADYDAKQDKLACPSCKKEQSFDEFFETRRMCLACQVKYTKLHITSGLGFIKNLQTKEAERVARLKEIEKEMYGQTAKSTVVNRVNGEAVAATGPVLPPIAPPKNLRPATIAAIAIAPPRSAPKSATIAMPVPPAGDQGTAPPPRSNRPKSASLSRTTQQPAPAPPKQQPVVSANTINGSATAAKKIISLQSNQAAQLAKALDHIAQYPGVTIESKGGQGGKDKQKSAFGTSKSSVQGNGHDHKARNTLEEKMQRLVQF